MATLYIAPAYDGLDLHKFGMALLHRRRPTHVSILFQVNARGERNMACPGLRGVYGRTMDLLGEHLLPIRQTLLNLFKLLFQENGVVLHSVACLSARSKARGGV